MHDAGSNGRSNASIRKERTVETVSITLLPICEKKVYYPIRREEPFFSISSFVDVVMDLSLKSVSLCLRERSQGYREQKDWR